MKRGLKKLLGWMMFVMLLIVPLSVGIVMAEEEELNDPEVNSETIIPKEEEDKLEFFMNQYTETGNAGTEHYNHDVSTR